MLESGGVYVRLANDGDKVVGVFCGEPFARSVHWTGVAYDGALAVDANRAAPERRPSCGSRAISSFLQTRL